MTYQVYSQATPPVTCRCDSAVPPPTFTRQVHEPMLLLSHP
ncbi:MAG TPA: hypothetical protein VF062_25705 [Candidatus Limnocylindrales bacterium]